MKTLEQIKNDYAKDLGYYDWENLMTEVCYFNNEEFFNHENELLILVQKECLKNAEKSTIEQYLRPKTLNYDELGKLITNENNIIK